MCSSDLFPRNGSRFGYYCLPCHLVQTKANVEKHHVSTRNYHHKRRYGITAAEADEMLAAQGGVCAVCRRADPEHVDHDHVTGKVRGMLCFNCNQALGNARDDVRVLQQLIRYLTASRGATLRLVGEEYRPAVVQVKPEPGSPIEVAFVKAMAG